MSATKCLTTPRRADSLLSRAPYGRWDREVLSTNMTTCREPASDFWNGAAVSMCNISMGVTARDVVWCGVGARIPLAIEHPEHEACSPIS